MVDKNKDFIFVAIQIMALGLKNLNNNKKLTIMDFIPRFG